MREPEQAIAAADIPLVRLEHDLEIFIEAVVAHAGVIRIVLADALTERFGGDSVTAMGRALAASDADLRARFQPR